MMNPGLYQLSLLLALALLPGCSNSGKDIHGINIRSSSFSGPVAIIFEDPSAPPLIVEHGHVQIDPTSSNIIRTSSPFISTATWTLNGKPLPGPDSPSHQAALRKLGQGSLKSSSTETKIMFKYAWIGAATDLTNIENFETLLGRHAHQVGENILVQRAH